MFHTISDNPEKLQTPVSRYNLVIKQYNDPINIQHNIALTKAYQNTLYKLWYRLQSNHRITMILLYFIPYVNILALICNIHLLIINELAIFKFSKNKTKIPDPLQNMVYEPILCTRSNSSYLYYEIEKAEVSIFNLNKHTEDRILKLKENTEEKYLRFMVYNQKFIAGYYAVVEYRLTSFIHLLASFTIIFLVYYIIYSNWACFSLLNPFDYRKCVLTALVKNL